VHGHRCWRPLGIVALCSLVVANALLSLPLPTADASSVIKEFTVPTSRSGPVGISSGPDKALWSTETSASHIGRVTTAGKFGDFPTPTPGSQPVGISSGPDKVLWFTERSANNIGRVTTTGNITEFAVPTAASGPTGITSGPERALWFIEQAANKIGRVTTSGAITESTIPTLAGSPAGISTGPDGALSVEIRCPSEAAGWRVGAGQVSGSITTFTPRYRARPGELASPF
jgi:virginiamycin B lyase